MQLSPSRFTGYRSNLHDNNTPTHPSSPSHKNKKKRRKKENRTNVVGRVTHRFCIHRCLLCNRISIRFWNSGLRVTRYPVKTSERGIPRAATKLTLADSQAYRSEFRGGYLENPCSRAGSVLIGLMKLRFMTDSRCWLLPAIFSVRPPLKLNPPPLLPPSLSQLARIHATIAR